MNITLKANSIIDSGQMTKTDFARKVGITRATLNKRLKAGEWKKGEIAIIKAF